MNMIKSQKPRTLAFLLVGLAATICSGFAPGGLHHPTVAAFSVNRQRRTSGFSGTNSQLLLNPSVNRQRISGFSGIKSQLLLNPSEVDQDQSKSKRSLFSKIVGRFDTVQSAGLENVMTQGIWGSIKRLHNPKTYLVLAVICLFKWTWLLESVLYWTIVAFCGKWYRARYVYKIPVWDRQPNWNNIITSREQEKNLKAYTCKTCGSTLFVAKSREFFFAGDTGIGGLGCFSCGAKGKDNFVNDRERIVEEVADIDDYFDYERPLDFVSAAERRKLLKEAKGDEEKANKLLMDRSGAATENPAASSADTDLSKPIDAEIVEPPQKEAPPPKAPPSQTKPPKPSSDDDDDILDLLDMD